MCIPAIHVILRACEQAPNVNLSSYPSIRLQFFHDTDYYKKNGSKKVSEKSAKRSDWRSRRSTTAAATVCGIADLVSSHCRVRPGVRRVFFGQRLRLPPSIAKDVVRRPSNEAVIVHFYPVWVWCFIQGLGVKRWVGGGDSVAKRFHDVCFRTPHRPCSGDNFMAGLETLTSNTDSNRQDNHGTNDRSNDSANARLR